MSTLSAHAIELERLVDLRHRAASRLKGVASTKGAPARAGDALAVLHALASKPETASDALALLHELQVHQVELDLQAEELHESRAELESALRRQIDLYDLQVFGCLTIDARRVLHELNLSAAEMLGLGRDDAFGLPLDGFLCTESIRRLREAIAGIDAGSRRLSFRLTLRPTAGPERQLLAGIGRDAAADHYLLSLAPLEDSAEPERAGGRTRS